MGPSEKRRREDSALHSLIEHSTTVDIPSCLSASGHASFARLSARVCLFDLSCCVRMDHCLDTIIPYAPSYSSSRTPSNADDPHTTSEKVNTFEDIHPRVACPCSVCSFSSPPRRCRFGQVQASSLLLSASNQRWYFAAAATSWIFLSCKQYRGSEGSQRTDVSISSTLPFVGSFFLRIARFGTQPATSPHNNCRSGVGTDGGIHHHNGHHHHNHDE